MKCKDQAGLHKEMARVYEMCKGTAFEGKEYLCVKQPSGIFYDQPRFTDSPSSYEFALGIVEDTLVWEGDRLYYTGSLVIAKGGEVFTGPAKPCWSWNPPAPPKPKIVSISVNGGGAIELVLPDGAKEFMPWEMIVDGRTYQYKSAADVGKMQDFISNLLEGKL